VMAKGISSVINNKATIARTIRHFTAGVIRLTSILKIDYIKFLLRF